MRAATRKHIADLMERFPEMDHLSQRIVAVVDAICSCYSSGGKVLICGNGGSAADGEHIAGELMKSFVLPRKLPTEDVQKLNEIDQELAPKLQRGVPTVVLSSNAALSTAIVNDGDPYMAFAQQVYVLGKPGDILVALSTSGNARNVVNAIKTARALGMTCIAFTGSKESESSRLADITLDAPSQETYRVQEYHLPLYHFICLRVESELFPGD